MPAYLLKLLSATAGEIADSELLARFVESRDEAAFAELVRRHGPTVYRVCRRLIGPASADDAFQATFLVLASRAHGVRKAGSVGSWLIGVAGRVSRQMRKRSARRQESGATQPEDIADRSAPTPDSCLLIPELSAALDDELTRLPDPLRDPVVLCLIHGRTQEEAAAELGGSVRTLRRRLERAKALLRLRLERRGIVPAVAAGLLDRVGVASAVPPELVRKATDEAFCFLAGGGASSPAAVVAKGMVGNMAKVKVSAVVAATAALFIGLGVGFADDPKPRVLQPLPPLVVPMANEPPPLAAQPDTTKPDPAAVRTANFIVHAPTPVMARAIAAEAEYQRKEIAKLWLGKELPAGEKPIVIRVNITTAVAATGATTFRFASAPKLGIEAAEMELRGSFLNVLETHLPHEVAHTVLAAHFGKPVVRWADEGIALQHESAEDQARQDELCRKLLGEGRGIRLKVLLPMKDYPRDMIALYTQGHSVARFLLTRPLTILYRDSAVGPAVPKLLPVVGPALTVDNAHQQLIVFLHLGLDGNTAESWDKAAKEVYGFESVEALEAAWLEYLKRPESKPTPDKPNKPVPVKANDDAPDLIPPTRLPGVANPAVRP